MSDEPKGNEETVVKCPVDICDYEGLSRSMHLHILQSSGGGHGPHGEIPEHLDLDNLEVVGKQQVDVDYPDERESEGRARLCPYCGRAFNGFRGIKIHVGQKTGQGVHPEGATDITKDDCPIAHVDEDMNVIEVVEENAMMPSTLKRIEGETDTVPEADVLELVDEFNAEGKQEVAERIREKLL